MPIKKKGTPQKLKVEKSGLKQCPECLESVGVLVLYKREKICEACKDYFQQEDAVYAEEYRESQKYK